MEVIFILISLVISLIALYIAYKGIVLIQQQTRPYVFFTIEREVRQSEKGNWFIVYVAVLRNRGITPALDLKILVTPQLKDIDNKDIPFINEPPSFMPPQAEIKSDINRSQNFYEKYNDADFKVEISYKDYYGKLYKEKEYDPFLCYRKTRKIEIEKLG